MMTALDNPSNLVCKYIIVRECPRLGTWCSNWENAHQCSQMEGQVYGRRAKTSIGPIFLLCLLYIPCLAVNQAAALPLLPPSVRPTLSTLARVLSLTLSNRMMRVIRMSWMALATGIELSHLKERTVGGKGRSPYLQQLKPHLDRK